MEKIVYEKPRVLDLGPVTPAVGAVCSDGLAAGASGCRNGTDASGGQCLNGVIAAYLDLHGLPMP